ncbi:MAG TPA: hypothetical protein VGR70_17510, partial [Stellaceae bacterium]|nr:hypothetical protein [Stellaceae bacterium]
MKKLIATGLLIAVLAVAGPAFSVNNNLSLKEAMIRFGLIGEWAAQCSLPPSGNNAHTHWSANSDTAGELLTDFGGGQTMTYGATSAELHGADQIRVGLFDNQDKSHLELIIEKQAGRLRTLSSVQSDGRVLIQNGRFESNGAD